MEIWFNCSLNGKMANVIIDNTTTTDVLALSPGVYRYHGGAANIPSIEPGYMIRLERDSVTGCAVAITNNGRIYTNILNSSSWGGWQEHAQKVFEWKTGTSSKTVAAGASTSFTIDVSKTGYTPKGIVGIVGTGTSSFAIQEFSINGSNASVYFFNVTNQEKTISNIRVGVLYEKS